jgi:hypothetical protein
MSDSVEAQVLGRKWFYPFRLPGGQVTDCYLPPDTGDNAVSRAGTALSGTMGTSAGG